MVIDQHLLQERRGLVFHGFLIQCCSVEGKLMTLRSITITGWTLTKLYYMIPGIAVG